jgi:hypothetical protein
MKIKLTLTSEDAAVVHDMYLRNEFDDIGVVGLTVLSEPSDKDIITMTVRNDLIVNRDGLFPTGTYMPVPNYPKKVILEISEDHSSFDDAAFLANLSRILMKQVKGKNIGPLENRGGHIGIELEMTPVEIMRLLKLYKDGHLDDLNIAMIMTVASFFSVNPRLDGGSKDYWKREYVGFLLEGRIKSRPSGFIHPQKNTRKKEKR